MSEKQYARAPTAALPITATAPPMEYSPSLPGRTIRLAKKTMVRYSRKMVRAEHSAFITLTSSAACMLSPNIVNTLAISWKTGFPGGCPTSSLYDDAMNSPQSQKDAVGSMVDRYVKAETTNTAAAAILFHRLNFLLSILLSFWAKRKDLASLYKQQRYEAFPVSPKKSGTLRANTRRVPLKKPDPANQCVASWIRSRRPSTMAFWA